MSQRYLGGFITANPVQPTSTTAKGEWTLQQQMQAQAASNWPAAPDSTLVLYLDAGNSSSYPGSGSTWTDLSIYGNNATLIGSPTYSSSNGGYITLNGTTSQYTSTASSSSFNLNSTDFTIELWAYISTAVTSGNLYYGYASMGVSGYETVNIAIWRSGLYPGCIFGTFADAPKFGTCNRADIGYVGATYNLSGAWHQLVFTSISGSLTFYIDGVQWATNTTPTMPNVSCPFYFGGYDGGGTRSLAGNISIARVYKRGLTSTQVATNFNQFKSRYGL